MAAMYSAGRATWRMANGQLIRLTTSRGFQSTSVLPAAQNFTMPAMSPTMTEGNIASWKVKEGDSFSTGDVLLEIETDKAQMDVEAQDDGIMAKITQGDGSKAVKVGTRIAVIAEPGDDIKTLEIPAKEKTTTSSDQEKPAASAETSKSSESSGEAPPPSEAATKSPQPKSPSASKPTKQTYPLYPSVQHLLHQNGLSESEADKIPSSGPQGRLLKGDVLAYLGIISSSYPSDLSTRLTKLEHLDLSNIVIAPQTPKAAAQTAKDTPEKPSPPQKKDIQVSISLASVMLVQKRIQDSLGIHMPLSTFVARATEVANDNLPQSQKPLTADELFDSILGLDKVSSTSRGSFVPQITASSLTNMQKPSLPKSDILDILSGSPKNQSAKAFRSIDSTVGSVKSASNVFTVTVPPADERRGKVFLERVKTILEVEPGRLVM